MSGDTGTSGPADRRGMPWRTAREVGEHGEQLACDHLISAGYQVIDRNWRCRHGEVDIIARDGGWLVFCEVKTRRSERFGAPIEAVTPVKAARLRRLVMAWLEEHGAVGAVRIDVIGIVLDGSGDSGTGGVRISHLKAVA